MSRPSEEEYFLELLDSTSRRATCDRGKCSAIAVKQGHLVASGYVGSPPKFPHCDTAGHQWEEVIINGEKRKSCIRTTHAEANLVIQAAKLGIPLQDTVIYCSMEPCITCTKLLIGVGIRKIIVKNGYHRGGRHLFEQACIEFKIINEKELYERS